jgi:hypothetical protein
MNGCEPVAEGEQQRDGGECHDRNRTSAVIP